MSEQNNQEQAEKEKTPTPVRGGRPVRPPSSNPLGNSPLLGPSEARPDLPTFPPPVQGGQPSVTPTASHWQQSSLLYNTPPPPEYIARPFDKRHDRQTIYIDARKAGALDALIKLVADGKKNNLVAEMVEDILAKHVDALQGNEELVKFYEDKYRKEYNL